MQDSLILFGAGASFGSDTIGVPPLGKDLFPALRNFGPDTWGRLDGKFADLLRTDFEAGVMQLGEERPHDLPPLQRVMAAYFFQFRPRTTSLYVRLGEAIKARGWPGVLASLNYDRLLERSLRHVGLEVTLSVKPAGTPGVELCLPHGCCHIFDGGVRMRSPGVSFHGFGLTTSGQPVIIGDPAEHQQRIHNDALPPIMSYFEPQKRTSAGAPFIETQRNRWAELARSARRIAIVGAFVRPHDTHIWDPLVTAPERITYVAGQSGAESFRAWKAKHRPNVDDEIIPAHFGDAYPDICKAVGLEA